MRAAQIQPLAYQVDVVGVAEFNSSYRRLERSICGGWGGGGAGVCAEPRNSCGQEAAGSGSDPPIAPPTRWEVGGGRHRYALFTGPDCAVFTLMSAFSC